MYKASGVFEAVLGIAATIRLLSGVAAGVSVVVWGALGSTVVEVTTLGLGVLKAAVVVLTTGLVVRGAGLVRRVVGALVGGEVTGLWTTTGAGGVVRTRGVAVVVSGAGGSKRGVTTGRSGWTGRGSVGTAGTHLLMSRASVMLSGHAQVYLGGCLPT